MAKYKKHRQSANQSRTGKRKVFDSPEVPMTRSEGISFVDALALSEIQKKLQETLEYERDEIVGRSWHDHHPEGMTALQYRNGYGKPRSLTCGSGTMQIQMPRLRTPYESKIVEKYQRLTEAMQVLLPRLYLHGLATGDFQPALGWLLGEEAPLSGSTIVRMKEDWQKDYEQWKNQPLQAEYLYVWADGIYPKGGPVDETLALLVVVGVNRLGEKKLLAIEEGYRESEESWTDLFRNMKKRGAQWLGLVVGDGIGGLWKAMRTVFPLARHQRCWVHKMRNILDKVPKKAHDEVLDHLRLIYHATSYKEAQRTKQEFIGRYRVLYPKAVQSLEEAGENLFTYFRFPRQHWKSIKTTNPIESLFSTVKLRTAAARRMRTRLTTVCLVFQLLKMSERRLRRLRGYRLIPDTIDVMRSTKSTAAKVRCAA